MKHEIQVLEEALLSLEVRSSAEQLEKILSDDFFEFGLSGNTYNKVSVLKNMPQPKHESMGLCDFLIISETATVVVCSYKITEDRSFRSSVWVKNGSLWQMRFHQASKA